MSSSRTRMAAVAGSLALSLSLVSAPAVMAQDGPEATIQNLLATIEAKDFEAMPQFFCDEFADDMGGLDFAELLDGVPPGLDVSLFLDSFIINAEIDSMDVASQTDTEAFVDLVGTMSMEVNPDGVEALMLVVAQMFGQELTDADIEQAKAEAAEGMPVEPEDISVQIRLVPGETMPWLVCSDLGMSDDDMADDGMSEEDMDEEDMDEEGES